MAKREKAAPSEVRGSHGQTGRRSEPEDHRDTRPGAHRGKRSVPSAGDPDVPQPEAELRLAAFLLPRRQARFTQLLATASGRLKLRLRLAHFADLDPAACIPIPSVNSTPSGIQALLVNAGAPPICFVLAESETLDGQAMPLLDALTAVVGQGSGALFSCLPGQLGYYEGEEPQARWLLRRNAT